VGLSFRVRNGTGRFPHAITTVTLDPATTRSGGVGNLWGHDTCPPLWCQVVWTTMVFSISVCLWTRPAPWRVPGCGLLLLAPYSRREHASVFLWIVDDALCTLPCCVPYQFLWWVVVGLLLPTGTHPITSIAAVTKGVGKFLVY